MTWLNLFYSYYVLLLSFWEFLWGFMDCEYPAINEAKRKAVIKIIKNLPKTTKNPKQQQKPKTKQKTKTPTKNLNNCSNSLLNAELSAAWRLRKQHLHNVWDLLQNISFTVIIPYLNVKCKGFYNLEKKNPSANFKVKSWEQTAKPASCR